MKTMVMAVAGYNLAETSRMIEIAKEARKYFNIVFMTYGGKFEYLIDDLGFERIKMQPQLTADKLEDLKKVLNGDKINSTAYFNKAEIALRVESEIAEFKRLKPTVIVTGWNLTVGLSARILKIPFVNVLHSTSIKEYYEAGLQSYPDYLDTKLLSKVLNYDKVTKRFNKRIIGSDIAVKPYNAVGKKYNLKPFASFMDLIEGDQIFLADIPEWVNLKIKRDNIHYIGPLPARLDIPVPQTVLDIKKESPVVFFAMGSSGKGMLVRDIINGFRGKNYTVIAPVASLIKDMDIDVPKNVIVTDFIPADKVNAMADVAVIHGGQNTVMNACLSGTPFVGVGMHVEQQANIDACVRKGFAIRISKRLVTSENILSSIDILLKDQLAKENIESFRKALCEWNAPKKASELLRELYDVAG